jgi:hypothetical protein
MTCVGPEYRDRSPFASNAWWHAQATGAVSPFTRAVPAVDRDHHTALNASQTDAAPDPGSSGGALVNTPPSSSASTLARVHVCVRKICNPKE